MFTSSSGQFIVNIFVSATELERDFIHARKGMQICMGKLHDRQSKRSKARENHLIAATRETISPPKKSPNSVE